MGWAGHVGSEFSMLKSDFGFVNSYRMSSDRASFKLSEIARHVPASEVRGDPDHAVGRFVHPAEVESGGDLCLLMTPGALGLLERNGSKHACAVVDRKLADEPEFRGVLAGLRAQLVVDRPRYALACITPLFRQQAAPPVGVHPSAVIEDGVTLGEDVAVGAGAWVGAGTTIGDHTAVMPNVSICEHVTIGRGCFLFPGAYIGHHVEIGDRVIVHPNAVLGGDGFAFESAAPNGAEEARRLRAKVGGKSEPLERIESLGTLRIEDDVEIGACTTIDRSTLGSTVVARGTKIDNLVQIGHGNRIGEDVLLCAQVGLAGSSKVGDGSILAGKVGVADHRNIGSNSVLMAKSGVTKDIPDGEIYYGMPARPVRETLRQYSLISQLEELKKRIATLEANSSADGQ